MNNIKTMLIASVIVAMILPFSSMNFAEAAISEKQSTKNIQDKSGEAKSEKLSTKHIRDKTKEIADYKIMLNEKMKKHTQYEEKIEKLEEKIETAKKHQKAGEKESKQMANDRMKLGKERSSLAKFEAIHKAANSIPLKKLTLLMKHQETFEKRLFLKGLDKFITSVGIDAHTKEIQVGLDTSTVNSTIKKQIINKIDTLMPKSVGWHIIDAERMTLQSACQNQKFCYPQMGGNTLNIQGLGACSTGFQATLGGIFGLVTAGHCVDNKVGKTVKNYKNQYLGKVAKEKFYFGTDCDCGFVRVDKNKTDNKVYKTRSSQVTIKSYTKAANQLGDYIYKSGQTKDGVQKGYVTGVNKSNWGYSPSVGVFYITGLVESTASSVGGDSGGTVMRGSSLYGIISGSGNNSYYHVPIDKIISKLGVAVILG